jgi:hypothetical protein
MKRDGRVRGNKFLACVRGSSGSVFCSPPFTKKSLAKWTKSQSGGSWSGDGGANQRGGLVIHSSPLQNLKQLQPCRVDLPPGRLAPETPCPTANRRPCLAAMALLFRLP